jgi:alpha-tubulin suppressor-like RCC1 family protein
VASASSVALGRQRACALLSSGEVVCWNTNDGNEPGPPQRIEGLRDARSLTMMPASEVACAVTARRTLACWGPAAFGLPNFPSGWASDRAVEHPSLADVRDVALAQRHYCVLHGGGRVACFEFGNDSPGLTGAHQIVATDNLTCALTGERGVACWGDPSLVGGGEQIAATRFIERPRPITGLTRVAALSAGTDSICALLFGGTARCWGHNPTGGLGDGTLSRRFVPVPLCNASGIVQLAAGRESCAVFSAGAVRCWGDLDALDYE